MGCVEFRKLGLLKAFAALPDGAGQDEPEVLAGAIGKITGEPLQMGGSLWRRGLAVKSIDIK